MGWYSCNKQPCIQWHVTTYPFPSLFVYAYTYRKDFRQAFGRVGVIRSLIPAATNVLACTATATEEIYLDVTNVLSMEKPHVIAMPPERPNIMYSVLEKKSLDEISDTIPPFTWPRETGLARSHGQLNRFLNRFKIAKTVAKPFYLNLLRSRFNVDQFC